MITTRPKDPSERHEDAIATLAGFAHDLIDHLDLVDQLADIASGTVPHTAKSALLDALGSIRTKANNALDEAANCYR